MLGGALASFCESYIEKKIEGAQLVCVICLCLKDCDFQRVGGEKLRLLQCSRSWTNFNAEAIAPV